MATMVKVKCARCHCEFMARLADRKRGWGKFCSKSCKAIKQEQRTGQHANYIRGKSAACDYAYHADISDADYGASDGGGWEKI